MSRLGLGAALLLLASVVAPMVSGCARLSASEGLPESELKPQAAPRASARPDAPTYQALSSAPVVDRPLPQALPAPTAAPETIPFPYRPPGASARVYESSDPRDQHRLVIGPGVTAGHSYSLLIGFHGQPRRGQAPREYAFGATVQSVVFPSTWAGRGSLESSTPSRPLILALPVFRFEGVNWPDFDVADFAEDVQRRLAERGIGVDRIFLFGHSGAAGCGGAGLNRAADMRGTALDRGAVGFFDTCVGAGFTEAVRGLARRRVPTFIAHSVETAGFRPRQRTEYLADFDFGRVYQPLGLRPTPCPERLPDAPLRPLTYRCAANPEDSARALVLDTGHGEAAHQALLPVALRYFLERYVNR
ncbi:MAG TPA: hypothetical protein VFQ61_30545 [Polyangiaceae bacterium]|nr:hypothetical protein [Polyangiaceae bacterium]